MFKKKIMWVHTRYGMIMSTATEQTTEGLMGVDTFLKDGYYWLYLSHIHFGAICRFANH